MARLTGSLAPRGHLLSAMAHMSPCDNTALLIHTTTSASVCTHWCAPVYVSMQMCVSVYTAILWKANNWFAPVHPLLCLPACVYMNSIKLKGSVHSFIPGGIWPCRWFHFRKSLKLWHSIYFIDNQPSDHVECEMCRWWEWTKNYCPILQFLSSVLWGILTTFSLLFLFCNLQLFCFISLLPLSTIFCMLCTKWTKLRTSCWTGQHLAAKQTDISLRGW